MQSQETKHDKWFRAEVEAALAEADDPNTEWVSHEIVRQEMAEEREKLRALVATEQKAAPAGLDASRPAESQGGDAILNATQPDGGAEAG